MSYAQLTDCRKPHRHLQLSNCLGNCPHDLLEREVQAVGEHDPDDNLMEEIDCKTWDPWRRKWWIIPTVATKPTRIPPAAPLAAVEAESSSVSRAESARAEVVQEGLVITRVAADEQPPPSSSPTPADRTCLRTHPGRQDSPMRLHPASHPRHWRGCNCLAGNRDFHGCADRTAAQWSRQRIENFRENEKPWGE